MRLRNIKNAEEILNSSKYLLDSSVKQSKKDIFKNNNPLHLEIGMGKGNFIIEMAKSYPDINFIGVEKYESVIARAAQKLECLELDNVRIICMDASKLDEVFGKEVDEIYLNFSDPWPKNRHFKRRLTYETYLKIYDKLFKKDASITIKTDNDKFFESTLVSLNNYGYVFDKVSLDLWNEDIFSPKTEYEQKFGNKGFKIKYLKAHKNLI